MPSIDTFSEAIHAFGVDAEKDPYAKAAKRMYSEEGHIEFDEERVVLSQGEGGAYVMAWLWVPDDALENSCSGEDSGQVSSSFVTSQFRNHYKCPACGYEWSDVWSAQCDDDCPSCGKRHITPHTSDDV